MKFCKTKMQKMRKKDKLIDFMIRDLIKCGHDEDYAMEVVFNSEILGDTTMEQKYINL